MSVEQREAFVLGSNFILRFIIGWSDIVDLEEVVNGNLSWLYNDYI